MKINVTNLLEKESLSAMVAILFEIKIFRKYLEVSK
jgi:hypothetical protein